MSQQQPEVKQLPLGGELSVCAACDYDGGFHIILKRVTTTRGGCVRMLLKCPSCAQVYDLDLVVSATR